MNLCLPLDNMSHVLPSWRAGVKTHPSYVRWSSGEDEHGHALHRCLIFPCPLPLLLAYGSPGEMCLLW